MGKIKLITFLSVFAILMILFGGLNMIKADSKEILKPTLINTKYDNKDVIVSDIDLIKEYKLKSSDDITSPLKEALNRLKVLGGGTVYISSGNYVIKESITIPNYCSVVGDYADPDKADFKGDYGTVILAEQEANSSSLPGLFRLMGSTGVVGLTVYYPGQSLASIKAYPYTFEIMGGANSILEHMQFTIKDVNLINSYLGVAASRTICNDGTPVGTKDAHEGLIIENLKGTPLKIGIDAVNESDVGYYRDITFSPRYYHDYLKFQKKTTDIKDIRDFLNRNSLAIQLGDLEWSPYYNINIDGYLTGVHIIKGTRIQEENPIAFMGAFYNLNITDVQNGLIVDDLYSKWGMLVTNSKIDATKIAIANNSPYSYVRLTNVSVSGGISGPKIYNSNPKKIEKEIFTGSIYNKYQKLYNAITEYSIDNSGSKEVGSLLQNAMNEIALNGGGILYLPSGYYRVSKALTIPTGVMLRGSSSVANRDNVSLSKGTVIMSYYDSDLENNLTQKAFITLETRSDLQGLRIVYPENNLKLSDNGVYSVNRTPFTIRVNGDYASVKNVGLVDSYNGISVYNANDVEIKNILGLFFNYGVKLEYSNEVQIENIISNATLSTQSGYQRELPEYFSGQAWGWDITKLWNFYTYTETHTKLISLNESYKTDIYSCFTFCSSNFLDATNSEAMMMGCGFDRAYRNGFVADLTGTNLVIVNQLKFNCYMYRLNTSKISIYGRMDLKLNWDFQDDVETNLLNNEEINETALEETSLYVPIDYPTDEELRVQGTFHFNPLKAILNDLK